jgi:beta-mannosidase
MFVEDWPSVNWGILDYWRNPKPGYYALATAYQRVLPSIASSHDGWKKGEKVALDLWITNDTLEDFAGSRLIATLQSPDGYSDEQALQVNVAADSSQKIMTLSWKKLPPGSYRLSVQLENAAREVLGRNLSTFRVEE